MNVPPPRDIQFIMERKMTDVSSMLRPIRNDADHAAALQAVDSLWSAEPESEEHDILDALVTLIDAYESKHFPIGEALDPVEVIEATMDTQGHTRAELNALIGSTRASEVLRRKRPLTLGMIRKLETTWHIPASVLVREYDLVAS